MNLDAEQLAFRARALTQAHPLTALAHRFVQRVVAKQTLEQPVPEAGSWASAALTAGYCLRRVEEADVGAPEAPPATAMDLRQLEEVVAKVAADLRTGDPTGHLLSDDIDQTFLALNRIIDSEVGRRSEYWEALNHTGRAELEDYVTWWVVAGYALRVAEIAQRSTA